MKRYELLGGHAFFDDGFEDDEDARREAWLEYRDELLAYWIQDPAKWKRPAGMSVIDQPEPGGPGTRPWAWWRYEAPEMRRPVEGTVPKRLMAGWEGGGCIWVTRPKGCHDKGWREATSWGGPRYLGGDVPWRYEGESDYLARLGLLTDAELTWLSQGGKPSPDENFVDDFSEECVVGGRRLAQVSFDLRDLHVYGGTLLAGVGAHLLHPGAGFLLVGLLLTYFGVRQVRK